MHNKTVASTHTHTHLLSTILNQDFSPRSLRTRTHTHPLSRWLLTLSFVTASQFDTSAYGSSFFFIQQEAKKTKENTSATSRDHAKLVRSLVLVFRAERLILELMIQSVQICHWCCPNRCFHLDYCFDVYDAWWSSSKDSRADVRRRVAYRCDDVNPLSVERPVNICDIEMVWSPYVSGCEWSSSTIGRKPCRRQYIYEVFLLKSRISQVTSTILIVYAWLQQDNGMRSLI